MAAVQTLGAPSIGAIEIKRYYQKGMLLALTLAVGLHLAVLGTVMLYSMLQGTAYVYPVTPTGETDGLVIIDPPPSMFPTNSLVRTTSAPPATPRIGIPIPVRDAEVVEHVPFATRNDLAALNAPVDLNGKWQNGDSVVFSTRAVPGLPSPGVFVHVDADPVPIARQTPAYPDIAALTERTGSVWVMALIDVDGSVIDARIAKASGANVGFEEAALAAALKSKYKPAINNGHPVAVWTTYRVDFKLDH